MCFALCSVGSHSAGRCGETTKLVRHHGRHRLRPAKILEGLSCFACYNKCCKKMHRLCVSRQQISRLESLLKTNDQA
ncbi:hypothetical protein AV530_009994 [Patagioenas fasciata monilis]|uniref:Uncharacterized protein n=1 Tax=Patagioenas fasciata monilis TaxID=372326 RepID=A0A1V4KCH5_PATFA|nr:hypothetical protein AV530_009994 [Patagioenas fasciata monilis]